MLDHLSFAGVRAAVRGARPGIVICYHRGYLLLDRQDSPTLNERAGFFLLAGTEGIGFLTQRKMGEFDYEYLFTKK